MSITANKREAGYRSTSFPRLSSHLPVGASALILRPAPNCSPAYFAVWGRALPVPNTLPAERSSAAWSVELNAAVTALAASTCWVLATGYISIWQ